jgi:hypothetical protein
MKGGYEILINIFNKVKNLEEFSIDWKIAIIHPIYKGKGNHTEPRNYAGILLLTILGEVFSGIFAGRLNDWFMNHNAFSEFQIGFVKGRKAMDNIFIIKTTVNKYLRFKRGRIYWCFLI